jgi:hypothetical protein
LLVDLSTGHLLHPTFSEEEYSHPVPSYYPPFPRLETTTTGITCFSSFATGGSPRQCPVQEPSRSNANNDSLLAIPLSYPLPLSKQSIFAPPILAPSSLGSPKGFLLLFSAKEIYCIVIHLCAPFLDSVPNPVVMHAKPCFKLFRSLLLSFSFLSMCH